MSAKRQPFSFLPDSGAHGRSVVRQDLVDRARSLVPLLSEHAEDADRLGRLPDVVVAALYDAGFLSLQVPQALAGPGADFRTAFEVYAELGRGCGSSGWLAMVLSGGSFMASLLGERARRELWAADPRAAVCSTLPSAGTARAVEGGLAVSGRWRPTSGVHHSAWAMVAVATEGEDSDLTLAVLPTSSGSTDSTWDVTGLRATGGDTVLFDDVFVPEHRLLSLGRMMSGGYAEDHPAEPLCAAAVVPALTVTLVAPLLGMGVAALEYALERLGDEALAHRAEGTGTRNAVADAASLIDTARLRLGRATEDVERAIDERRQPDPVVQARIHMDAASAARDCREAVRQVLAALGSASFAAANPVQRIWRDMEIALSHANIAFDTNREAYGRALLGPAGGHQG